MYTIVMAVKTLFFSSVSNGFDVPKLFDKLISLQKKKLDDERYGLGHAKSDVVLIIPYISSISNTDKEYCIEQIRKMREQIPGKYSIVMKTNKLKFILSILIHQYSINFSNYYLI